MDDKTNEEIKEVIVEAAQEEQTEENSETVAESAEEAPIKKTNKKLRNALLRAGAAVLAALILLTVSKFSAIDLIRGAKESDSVQDEEIGTFVKRDVFAIIGFYDASADDSTHGEYALVPMNGKFVTVHFSKRYLDSAAAIETETYSYINGSASTLDSYVTVQGTTENLSDALSTKMYDWFELNKDWMVQASVIADTTDNAEYLTDVVLEVDTVNSMSQTLVFVITGLAAAFLLYAIVEFVLMAAGVYLDGPRKKKEKKSEEASQEDSEEGIISEEKSENNEVSETDASDVQEEKE